MYMTDQMCCQQVQLPVYSAVSGELAIISTVKYKQLLAPQLIIHVRTCILQVHVHVYADVHVCNLGTCTCISSLEIKARL